MRTDKLRINQLSPKTYIHKYRHTVKTILICLLFPRIALDREIRSIEG
ncbi:MAG: hypothetical protein KME57_26335 [Scytonema hyalinum WJT4-NPBG1]|nr:hypothetical protein [Scytonema hyalinum WJT4-NPBG1]